MTTTSDIATVAAPPVRDLTPFFCPKSIAVVGASRKEGSVGHAIVRNLIYGGYTGVVYPINPQAKSILGIRCCKDLGAVGEAADLVVVVVPATHVEGVVLQAADQSYSGAGRLESRLRAGLLAPRSSRYQQGVRPTGHNHFLICAKRQDGDGRGVR